MVDIDAQINELDSDVNFIAMSIGGNDFCDLNFNLDQFSNYFFEMLTSLSEPLMVKCS